MLIASLCTNTVWTALNTQCAKLLTNMTGFLGGGIPGRHYLCITPWSGTQLLAKNWSMYGRRTLRYCYCAKQCYRLPHKISRICALFIKRKGTIQDVERDIEHHEVSELNFGGAKFCDSVKGHECHKIWHPMKLTRYTVSTQPFSRPTQG